MAGFDCKCPYCDKEIPVYDEWVAHDYSTGFTIAREHCGRTVQIDVRMVKGEWFCDESQLNTGYGCVFDTSKHSCLMCNRAEPGDNGLFCDPCHKKLIELSKHNMDQRR